MSKSALLLVALALALAVSSGYLLRELRTERARAVALQARVAELEGASDCSVPPAESPSPQTTDEGSHETVAPAPTCPAPAAASAKNPRSEDKRSSSLDAELKRQLADPEVRATRIAYTRLELERQYRDLATALNLQPDEAARLLDLLAKQKMDQDLYEMRANAAYSGDRLTDEEWRTRREQDAERRRQVETERAALLGEAKLAELNEYLKTLPARAEMRELRTMLAETSYPLRGDQATPMVAALAAEQERHGAERTSLYESAGNPTTPTPEETIQYMHKRLDLIEQSLRRRHQLATDYLDTEQLKRYDEMLNLERRRAQIDYDEVVAVNRQAQRDGTGR